MTVGKVLDDITDMDAILSRLEIINENNPSYYRIWYNDVERLREIFSNYKKMLCDLEIKEKK